MPARLTDRQTGVILALSGVLLISLDSLWIRLSEAGSWDVAFWVGLFTFLVISIVLPVRTGDSIVTVIRRDRVPLVASSLLNTCSVTMFIVAVGLTTVANTVAIIAAAPIAAAVVARLIIGERPATRTWWAIAGSVAGILVIVAGSIGAGSVAGDGAAVIAVLAFAGNVTLWRKFPGISRLAVIGLGGLFIALVTYVPANPFELDGRALAILAIMGLLTGPAGRVALASSTRHLPAAQVGLFTPVETVAATAWAWLFLGESPPTLTVLGGIIVIVSVLYGSYRRPDVPTNVQ
ncbi:MAG: DMT family transporter [Acidimicrobiia bacterium]